MPGGAPTAMHSPALCSSFLVHMIPSASLHATFGSLMMQKWCVKLLVTLVNYIFPIAHYNIYFISYKPIVDCSISNVTHPLLPTVMAVDWLTCLWGSTASLRYFPDKSVNHPVAKMFLWPAVGCGTWWYDRIHDMATHTPTNSFRLDGSMPNQQQQYHHAQQFPRRSTNDSQYASVADRRMQMQNEQI